MITELKQAIAEACSQLFGESVDPAVTRPDEKFGDFATNAALQLAKKLGKNPAEISQALAAELAKTQLIKSAEPAGPGFINIRLSDERLVQMATSATDLPKLYDGQEVLVEFGDPNPFKPMHIGHLYSSIVGDTISRLLELSGAKVRRLSYHGDVGLHVAKAIWAMLQDEEAVNLLKHKEEELNKSSSNPEDPLFHDQVLFSFSLDLGIFYQKGNEAYESGSAKEEIVRINKQIYTRGNPEVNRLYQLGTKFSLDAFDETFRLLGVKYSPRGRYLESNVAELGLKTVRSNTPGVFAHSGNTETIIFPVTAGTKDLHTRVFVNEQGLPTYEAKDLGLALLKDRDYPKASKSIIVTATEQKQYFQVVLNALSKIRPKIAAKTQHITHGFITLPTGKMSSRQGNIKSANSLIWDVESAVTEKYSEASIKEKVHLAALKYSFLKNRLGSDIVFDVDESIVIEGNSGPYLQYAHARAASILNKAKAAHKIDSLDEHERSLALKISEYPEVVGRSVAELMPHHVCTYLYELAQNFNRFYEHSRVVGDEREGQRAQLVSAYKDVLRSGLGILNIEAPEKI